MTVAQLVAALQEMPQDAMLTDHSERGGWDDVSGVMLIKRAGETMVVIHR